MIIFKDRVYISRIEAAKTDEVHVGAEKAKVEAKTRKLFFAAEKLTLEKGVQHCY